MLRVPLAKVARDCVYLIVEWIGSGDDAQNARDERVYGAVQIDSVNEIDGHRYTMSSPTRSRAHSHSPRPLADVRRSVPNILGYVGSLVLDIDGQHGSGV